MSLPEYISRLAVSSVSPDESSRSGKGNLFDGNPETCWQSDAGGLHWIRIDFKNPVTIRTLRIQFQGGFAAEEACLKVWNDADNKISFPFFPTNTNGIQSFDFSYESSYSSAAIVLKKATDFFGRIIIYHLDFSFA